MRWGKGGEAERVGVYWQVLLGGFGTGNRKEGKGIECGRRYSVSGFWFLVSGLKKGNDLLSRIKSME